MDNEQKITQLEQENKKLKEKLLDFKRLEEELLIDKVFKAAKDKLIKWYTLGGIGIFILSIYGVNFLIDYVKDMVTKKVNTISEQQIKELIDRKSEEQVIFLIKGQEQIIKDRINLFAKRKTEEIQIVTGPIGDINSNAKIATKAETTNVLAPHIDLSKKNDVARDQGDEPSSTGFAFAEALNLSFLNQKGQNISFSPRFIYNSVNKRSNSSVTLTDVLNFLEHTGAVEEKYWPYAAGQYSMEIPKKVADSKHYKIRAFYKIDISVEEYKKFLAMKMPIVAGIIVNQSFNSTERIVEKISDSQVTLGYHPICIVGYDDKEQLFKFKNSWGKSWGENGYGYVRYKDINNFIRQSVVIQI